MWRSLASLAGAERHAHQLQQLPRFFVGPGRGDDRHVHAPGLVDLHVVDLREQQLVLQPHREVAAPVEPLRRHAAEVADARQRDGDQAVEEFVHPLAAQGHHGAHRHALAQLELRDRLGGAAHDGLLTRDAADLVGADIGKLGVRRRLAQPHVDDHLLDAGDRHHVAVAELLLERRRDFLQVAFLEAAHLSTTPSHLRQMRTLRSPSTRWPMRVILPHSGHTSWTLLACTVPSRSTIPPLMLRCGFGFVWRLMTFTPSTMTRFLSGMTLSTRPRLPLSRPVVMTTLSFFRIDGCMDYRTSGASEMIFMKRRSRSSRATGPNTRVPIGSFWSLINTAALRSKRM